jgi:hypothetical protein
MIVGHRLVNRVKTVQQILVKWSSSSESLATWEDAEALKQRFLCAPAWGQACSSGGASHCQKR